MNKIEDLPFCACGCGGRVTKKGNKWINGHNAKSEHPRGMLGKVSTRKLERVPVKCKQCGDIFYVLPKSEQIFCSRKCSYKWRSENISGEDAAHWKGGKVTVICEYCGKEIIEWISQLQNRNFCDKVCYDKWQIESGVNSGENSPSWKGGKIKSTCDWCSKEIFLYESYLDSHDHTFCCGECKGHWWSKNMVGDKAPRWDDKKVIIICDYCGEKFYDYKKLQSKYRFCSQNCHYRWRSENIRGDKVHNWQGGISFDPYCEKFNPTKKREVRDKYNNCDYLTGIHRDICNKTKTGKVRELTVHHVDYNKQQGCEDYKWLLIPVSARHNTMFNKDRPFWKRLIVYALEYDHEYY